MKKLHLIYLPGLSKKDPAWQRRAVDRWSRYGVSAELFELDWFNKTETWGEKKARLLGHIDQAAGSGRAIALVGASAGASAAITAFAARKNLLVGVITIAGKINRPDTLGPVYRRDYPALQPAVMDCQSSLALLKPRDRQRMICRYGLFDRLVVKADSTIDGARNQLVPSMGHSVTIGIQIYFGTTSFIYFFRQLP